MSLEDLQSNRFGSFFFSVSKDKVVCFTEKLSFKSEAEAKF